MLKSTKNHLFFVFFLFIFTFVKKNLDNFRNMRILKITLFIVIVLFLLFFYYNNKDNNVAPTIHTEAVVVNASLKHVQGVVIDATMNGFTMVTQKDDTLYISTMDQDITLKGGLLLGDTLDVSYTVTSYEPTINTVSTMKKIH